MKLGLYRCPIWLFALSPALGCSSSTKSEEHAGDQIGVAVEGTCNTADLRTVSLASTGEADYLRHTACTRDFQELASEPIDATLAGARSTKVVYDTAQDDGGVYFQNGVIYTVHFEFVSTHLSGNRLPTVPQLSSFNRTEYCSPSRRWPRWYTHPRG